MSLLSTAASGLQAQTARLDTVSNNIANLNTAGYQRVSTSFADTLTQVFGQAPAVLGLPNRQTPAGLWLGTGVYALPSQRSFAAGAFHQTGNPLDFAIQGDGFFTVGLPGGGVGYTRAGSFGVSQSPTAGQFYLSTQTGYPVLASDGKPINVTGVNVQTVQVSPTGKLTADRLNGTPVALGTLGLAYTAHPSSALASVGQDVYALNPGYKMVTNAAGGPPMQPLIGQVAGGALEMSNVNLTQEMTSLIKTQNDFNMAAQAVNIADKMMGLANTL